MTFGLLLSDFFKFPAFQIKFLLGIMYFQNPSKKYKCSRSKKMVIKTCFNLYK
jgi:hypothetical protein